ncbi:prefoldin subunit 2-like [Symsagittifera roscoffensis]|uniref:prefoldin subunit 2-like n=1 Tax=Symsagittifera roscoffensis TaxID=84072 RepID=UPI00307B1BAC
MTAAKSTSSSSSQQSSASSSGTSNKPNAKQDEIVKGFHKLRQEQHVLSEKTSDLKSRISEHKSVIAALEKVSKDRKCYRMVDQALVERKVEDVLPELVLMRSNLENSVSVLQQKLEEKGTELVNYKAKFDIRIQGEES